MLLGWLLDPRFSLGSTCPKRPQKEKWENCVLYLTTTLEDLWTKTHSTKKNLSNKCSRQHPHMRGFPTTELFRSAPQAIEPLVRDCNVQCSQPSRKASESSSRFSPLPYTGHGGIIWVHFSPAHCLLPRQRSCPFQVIRLFLLRSERCHPFGAHGRMIKTVKTVWFLANGFMRPPPKRLK